MKEIIFDSSFLMAVAEHPTTWREDMTESFGSYAPLLLDCVRRELVNIEVTKKGKASMARVALELSKDFAMVPTAQMAADDEIVSSALQRGAAVATLDAKLTGTLRALHVQVIGLRSGRVFS